MNSGQSVQENAGLEDGQRWDSGFMEGLANSSVFVPIVSVGSVGPMCELGGGEEGGEDWTDNVLLEWMAALELHQRHTLERPLLPEPSSACVLFLALCRTGRLEDASQMLSDLDGAHPRPTEPPTDVSWRDDRTGEAEEPMW